MNHNLATTYDSVLQFLGYEGKDKHIFFESIYKKMSSGPVAERFKTQNSLKNIKVKWFSALEND